MSVQIGARVESDFTDPVGMLQDCHRRIERFLGVLRVLGEQAGVTPLTPGQRKSLQTSLRYFREGAPRHVQDEEISLFPRLRRQRSAKVGATLAIVERLERDHSTVEAWHQELDRLGGCWLKEGTLAPTSIVRFQQLTRQLWELYEKHIHVEDNELFPLAAATLALSDLNSIGQEMAQRRGARVPAALAAPSIQAPERPDSPAD
jgi:hemerythrin-like domain-containing protein